MALPSTRVEQGLRDGEKEGHVVQEPKEARKAVQPVKTRWAEEPHQNDAVDHPKTHVPANRRLFSLLFPGVLFVFYFGLLRAFSFSPFRLNLFTFSILLFRLSAHFPHPDVVLAK